MKLMTLRCSSVAIGALVVLLAACGPITTVPATTALPAATAVGTTAPTTIAATKAPATTAPTTAPAPSATPQPASTTVPSLTATGSPTKAVTSSPTATPTRTLTPTRSATPSKTATATPIPFVAIGNFVGTWNNTNAKTGSWIRLEIAAKGSTIAVHSFGACTPTPCDAGTAMAAYTGNPFTVSFDSGFATRKQTLTLTGSTLHVTTFTHFTDGSGRADFSSEDDFKK